MANYRNIMPSMDELNRTIRKFTDFTLPSSDLNRYETRARREARNQSRLQSESLKGLHKTLSNQRATALSSIRKNMGLLPSHFNKQLQDLQRNFNQGGPGVAGSSFRNFVKAGSGALSSQASELQQLMGQYGQAENTFLRNLVSQVFNPQRQLALQQGQEAAKRYRSYITKAQEAMFQGRVQKAEDLLSRAQREYNAAVRAEEGRFLQQQQGYAENINVNANASGLPSKATRNVQLTPSAVTAYNMAAQMGLRLTSAYRDPAHNRRVGGSNKSMHMQGRAYDFAGSKSAMNRFAQWARNSGLFRQVIWQAPGHYDHVHVSW